MGPVQASVHVDALISAHISELNGLELLSDPIANLAVLNVHELNANLAGVGIFVGLN